MLRFALNNLTNENTILLLNFFRLFKSIDLNILTLPGIYLLKIITSSNVTSQKIIKKIVQEVNPFKGYSVLFRIALFFGLKNFNSFLKPFYYMKYILTILCLVSQLTIFSQNIQWSNKVDDYSSTYGIKLYLPEEVLGEPNCVPQGGDIPAAWAPAEMKTEQSIKVSFKTPAKAKRVIIVESFNPGALSKIIAYDINNKETLLQALKAEKYPASYKITSIPIPAGLEIKAIKIFLNTTIDSVKNSIDAIGISSDTESFLPQIHLPADLVSTEKPNKLPSSINTLSNELGPLVLADGRSIIFSRSVYSSKAEENKEEMWQSDQDESWNWKEPFKLPKPLNSGNFSFVSSITPDGNSALLGTSYDPKGEPTNGCCSFSHRTEDGWALPENINMKNYYNLSDKVNHALSSTGKILIISAERNDSEGYRDLYISFLQETGKWSEPKNLGFSVCTAADDYAPFLASDDRTLYFSTAGWPGYGKSDIFVIHRIGDDWFTWSKPQNLGPVINSDSEDAYFSITASGDDAYYCSGTETNMDIYEINLSVSQRPHPVVLVKGKVINKKTNEPVIAKVYYEDLQTGIQVGHARSRHKTGQFQVILSSGTNYGYHADAKGYLSISQNLDLTDLKIYKELEQDLQLVPLEPGAVVRLNNLFFDYKMADLKAPSFPELNRLIRFLNENKTVEFEIQGFTDSVGTPEYNLRLSADRAKAVSDYLMTKGIEPKRLKTKAFGETKPLSDNSSEKGRMMNRRVEFVITKK